MLPQPILEWYEIAQSMGLLWRNTQISERKNFLADFDALRADLAANKVFVEHKMCADDLTVDSPQYTVNPANYPNTPIYIKVIGAQMEDGPLDLSRATSEQLPHILTDICTSIFAAYRKIRQFNRKQQVCAPS